MSDIRIEQLLGMDSSAFPGMTEKPTYLQNVVHTRDGGYAPAPGMTQGLTADPQRTIAFGDGKRLFYTTQGTGGVAPTYAWNLETSLVDYYGDLAPLDIYAPYGNGVLGAGVGATPGTYDMGAANAWRPFQARAFGRNEVSSPVIADLNMTATAVALPGYTTPPTSMTSPYRHAQRPGFQTGFWRLVTVYFRRRKGTQIGSTLNPSNITPTYLGNAYTVYLPAYPSGIPGEYYVDFTFTGLPDGYEPVFFGFDTEKVPGYRITRPSLKQNLPGTALAVGEGISVITNGGIGIWYAEVAGTLDTAFKADVPYTVGDVAQAGTATLKFVGYSAPYTPDAVDEKALYDYFTNTETLNGPAYLMADYINRVRPEPLQTSGVTPYYRWAGLKVDETGDGQYRLYWEGNEESDPERATFLPVGTKTAVQAGRTWVAPDYVIRSGLDATQVRNDVQPWIVNTLICEEATLGTATVYYSELHSIEFRESFIVLPFRRSQQIVALTSSAVGLVALGDSDAVIVSGDSEASFRASPVPAPGALSQATAASYQGVVVYCTPTGLYLLESGGATEQSLPVAREWGGPVALSVDEAEASVLIQMSDGRALHYDIRRRAWNVWTLPHRLLALSAPMHALQQGTGEVMLLTNLFSPLGPSRAEFRVDGGHPGVRKTFRTVSYRKDGQGVTALDTRSPRDSIYTRSSTTTDPDPTTTVHRINVAGETLLMRLEFAVPIGGPIIIDVNTAKPVEDIRRT